MNNGDSKNNSSNRAAGKSNLVEDYSDITKVDLGDDLLLEKEAEDKSKQIDTHVAGELRLGESIDEDFRTAEILITEGLPEEAKRILHNILIADPTHMPARKCLHEIHEEELKELFSDEASSGVASRRMVVNRNVLDKRLERISESTRAFDDELSGILNEWDTSKEPWMFGDQKKILEWAKYLDKELGDLSSKDRIDIGIAFFEMDLLEIAARQFETAGKKDLNVRFEAGFLLANTWIQLKRGYEAIKVLEPLIRDEDLQKDKRPDFLYLLGRSRELIEKNQEALGYYMEVEKLNSNYRDTRNRIKELKRKIKRYGELKR